MAICTHGSTLEASFFTWQTTFKKDFQSGGFTFGSNRYTFVWGKSIKTNKGRIQKQLKELWSYVEKVYKDEQHIPNTPDFEAIDADKVEAAINQINRALKGKDIDKKVKQKLNYAKNNWPSNLKKHESQESILKGRNSYSKTDPDATFNT